MDPEDWQRRKLRIQKAIEDYTNKNRPKVGPVRHNGAPEKELEVEVLKWLRANGFHVSVVESKATYNPKAGKYISQSVKDGFVDLVGNHNSGIAVFIELKAPGCRSKLRENQRDFLLQKIETGCFAICTDSVELLSSQFEHFQLLRSRQQFSHAKDFLRTALPVKREKVDDEPLFPEE